MSKPTPGPWVIRDFPTARGGLPAHWVLDSIPDDDRGQVIANAICTVAMSNDDAAGNARLIAAAPQLREHLSNLIAMVELMPDYTPGTDLYTEGEVAKLLIAEIDGSQP